MKARRVFVMLELETDLPLSVLRDKRNWTGKGARIEAICHQVQANAARGATNKVKGKSKK